MIKSRSRAKIVAGPKHDQEQERGPGQEQDQGKIRSRRRARAETGPRPDKEQETGQGRDRAKA